MLNWILSSENLHRITNPYIMHDLLYVNDVYFVCAREFVVVVVWRFDCVGKWLEISELMHIYLLWHLGTCITCTTVSMLIHGYRDMTHIRCRASKDTDMLFNNWIQYTINMPSLNHLMATHYLKNVCVCPHNAHTHTHMHKHMLNVKNDIQFTNKSQRVQLNLNM